MMLSIFSCIYLLSEYLWRKVFSNLLSMFSFLCVFLLYWVSKDLYEFWIQVFYLICALQIFSPDLWLVFSFSSQCFSKSRSFNLFICFMYRSCSSVLCEKLLPATGQLAGYNVVPIHQGCGVHLQSGHTQEKPMTA